MKTMIVLVVAVATLVGFSAAAVGTTAPASVADQRVAVLGSAAAGEGLESQAGILADGEVTFTEYGQAVQATVDCLEAVGYEAHADLAPGAGGFSITIASPGSPQVDAAQEAMAPLDAAYDACDRQYKRLVEGVYRTGSAK
ncbi:MAG: hypothetical protein GWP04_06355 [Gammaproteobacteria bacterium]|nr:hypothetical protein [Gammaproteobacteria bacterium]